MSSIRFGRGREYQLFRREDVKTRWDLASATQFLNGFRSDPLAMSGLRKQALNGDKLGGQSKLTDEQAINVLARMLVSGDLLVVLPQRDRNLGHLSIPMTTEAPAPAPAPRSAPEKKEDPSTFDSSHDGVAQAAVLIAAAKAAYPFCEECQKAEVERLQGAGAR